MPKPSSNSPEGKARILIDDMLKNTGWEILPEGSSVPEKGRVLTDSIRGCLTFSSNPYEEFDELCKSVIEPFKN